MASYTGSKINQLLKVWSAGTVAWRAPWLEKHGIYQQLVHEYEKTSVYAKWGRALMLRQGTRSSGPADFMQSKSN